jgi:hypothetical protein
LIFLDSVRALSNQLSERRAYVRTEEAVKQALILPFFSILGYDVHNPAEFIPEFRAGWSKGSEKVDYGIQLSGKLAMLVEAKGLDETLTNYDAQLAKYFNSTPEVKFAIITNGIYYKFFTDLQEKNILDKSPFFEFDFENFNDHNILVLENFRKDVFSAEKLVSYAEDLVYLSKLKDIFKRELRDPSEAFIRFALDSARIVDGRITQAKLSRFEPLIKQSISSAILEIVGQSFQPQINTQVAQSDQIALTTPFGFAQQETSEDVANEDELNAFNLTEKILYNVLPNSSELKYVKTKTYLSISYSKTWFVRYTIHSRLKRAAYFRLPLEQVKQLAPELTVEEAPAALGMCRIYFENIEDIYRLEKLLLEAVKSPIYNMIQ